MTAAINPLTATASELQAKLEDGSTTSKELVDLYLHQIARYDGYLEAVLAVTPQDLLDKTASELDEERANGKPRGPLHGISILIEDNIATAPALGLPTTCGSLALVGSRPTRNAAIIDQLIAAGAIILGKTNLSEWAWFRSDLADSGWSAVGGQTQSAYVRGGFCDDDTGGGHSNPGSSSTGSAVAVAAGFSPLSIGTETMGSLIMPSDRSALYTIKPTLQLVPQDGMILTTPDADSAGPMTKSVLDLANLLDILVDPTKTTVPENGYTSCVTGSWGDIKIGVVEPDKWLFCTAIVKYEKEAVDQMMREWQAAYDQIRSVAKVVKPVTLLSVSDSTEDGENDIYTAFTASFKSVLEGYLADIDDSKIHTLEELIEFNKAHAEQELPPNAEYQKIVQRARDRAGKNGIDKVLNENGVDVIIGPGDGPMFIISGTAAYPVASLPLGYLDFNGRAFGMQAIAKAPQEALLIQLQSAWEATFPFRQPPDLEEIVGGRAI